MRTGFLASTCAAMPKKSAALPVDRPLLDQLPISLVHQHGRLQGVVSARSSPYRDRLCYQLGRILPASRRLCLTLCSEFEPKLPNTNRSPDTQSVDHDRRVIAELWRNFQEPIDVSLIGG